MRHLDEGTVHAFVDGALDAARTREVEEHLAACESCRDAVREARGLAAASSRILSALDSVPGNVVPPRARAARDGRGGGGGGGGGHGGDGPSARGLAGRWGWAVAAVAVLAVGAVGAVGAVLVARSGEPRIATVRLAQKRAGLPAQAGNAAEAVGEARRSAASASVVDSSAPPANALQRVPAAAPAPAPRPGASRAAEPDAGTGGPGGVAARTTAAQAKAALPRRIDVDSAREAGGVVVRTRYAWANGVVLTLVATPPGVHAPRGVAADAMPVRSAPAAGEAAAGVNAIEWTGADGTRYRLWGAASVAELERARASLP